MSKAEDVVPTHPATRSKSYAYGSLVLLLVLFVALTILSGNLLTGLRIDLTDNRLYTLSDGTRNILDGLEEPVNLYMFFSEDASRDLPQVRTYAQRVRELIEEFANNSNGLLNVQFIDPKPFSEEEDRRCRIPRAPPPG